MGAKAKEASVQNSGSAPVSTVTEDKLLVTCLSPGFPICEAEIIN